MVVHGNLAKGVRECDQAECALPPLLWDADDVLLPDRDCPGPHGPRVPPCTPRLGGDDRVFRRARVLPLLVLQRVPVHPLQGHGLATQCSRTSRSALERLHALHPRPRRPPIPESAGGVLCGVCALRGARLHILLHVLRLLRRLHVGRRCGEGSGGERPHHSRLRSPPRLRLSGGVGRSGSLPARHHGHGVDCLLPRAALQVLPLEFVSFERRQVPGVERVHVRVAPPLHPHGERVGGASADQHGRDVRCPLGSREGVGVHWHEPSGHLPPLDLPLRGRVRPARAPGVHPDALRPLAGDAPFAPAPLIYPRQRA
mmetsp:Transcript_55414/g.131607  ORF Transcript_55414/g.131607 Transcript_55414/m.131607 type:complete len:314 (+) Transcript_55414:506-1447(+)